MSVAVAVLCRRLSTIPRPQPRSPRSRTAGAGPGVRAALTFPPTPFLSHAAGEEGGDDAPTLSPFRPCRSHQGRGKGGSGRNCGGSVPTSVNDTASTTQITLLPQRGRGAGGEGGPYLPPSAPAAPTEGEERGEVSVAVAVLCRRLSTIPRPQLRSPLSRSAGAGPGVRAALTFPLPPLPLPSRERKWGR